MRIVAATTIVTALLVSAAAVAQHVPCGPRADMTERLGQTYGERQAARGVASNGALIELWRSPDGATWTLIATLPDGRSCGLAAGDDWQAVPRAAALPGIRH